MQAIGKLLPSCLLSRCFVCNLVALFQWSRKMLPMQKHSTVVTSGKSYLHFLLERWWWVMQPTVRLLDASTAHRAPFHGLLCCVPQWLQVCGCCSRRHEERDSADQWAQAETGEHWQDSSVAGVRSGLGGTEPALGAINPDGGRSCSCWNYPMPRSSFHTAWSGCALERTSELG